jgi:putative Holliday junction resolvase
VADRRTVGLDLGERRIGVALCDSGGLLATPYEVLARSGDRGRDHRAIAALVEEADAVRVVVGLPRSLDGARGVAADAVLAEVDQLRAVLAVPVYTHDERLTTVTAERSLRKAGLDGRQRRKVVDQVAATVILQAWLDAETAGHVSPAHGAPAGPIDRSNHA